jgi:hypothetical protein
MNDEIIYRYKGYKTIRFPISESSYEQFMNNREYARSYIDDLFINHPELFMAIPIVRLRAVFAAVEFAFMVQKLFLV